MYLSMLRAHFYVISFTKNELRVSIISTAFNDFKCVCSCRKQIKTSRLLSLFHFHFELQLNYLDIG